MKREAWLPLARDVDWTFSPSSQGPNRQSLGSELSDRQAPGLRPSGSHPEHAFFPPDIAGIPWLPADAWRSWDEPFKTSFASYVETQAEKETSFEAVRELLGQRADFARLPRAWLSALKLHAATLPLAEFAASVGNLRAARFGRTPAWRAAATLGALDELRHAQIPLALHHELVRDDPQWDWVHRFYHSDNWVAIAARHMLDELLLASNPIEFAVGTHFVFETGFTNLQFLGLTTASHQVGDRMMEKTMASIQSDEARHAQIGEPVLRILVEHDPAYAQRLVDKWFWRSWQLFAVLTGFAMDYLTPLAARQQSFKEFVEEWIMGQFLASLESLGLEKPWYWATFETALAHYHHSVYLSAYTYRASVWFDLPMPSPAEREWLAEKYPSSWNTVAPLWQNLDERWRVTDPGNDFGVHGMAIVPFCELCQLVLCGGTPRDNTAQTVMRDGEPLIFCSEPCRVIYEREPDRYRHHQGVVKRVLAGRAPANLIALVRQTFGLTREDWGKDLEGGDYPWLKRP